MNYLLLFLVFMFYFISFALQGQHLRQMIDEQYTATSLLGLSHGSNNRDVKLMPSALVCGNRYEAVLSEHNWLAGDGSIPGKDSAQKRVRRSGKYSPQERERIRYVSHKHTHAQYMMTSQYSD